MTLDSERIAKLVDECAPIVEGSRVENVHQCGSDSVVVTFFNRDSGKNVFLFCVHPGLCRFHLLPGRPPALPSPPSFCQGVRSCLKNSRLSKLGLGADQWTVELEFDSAAHGTRFVLRMRVGSRNPELTLVDVSGQTLHALQPIKESEGGGGCTQFSADEYRALASRAPLSSDVSQNYAGQEVDTRLDENRRVLRRQATRALAQKNRVLEKVERDLANIQSGDEARRYGELLKSALGRIRRGMPTVEVEDYFDPELPKVTVPLRIELTPKENVERYFKRYKKSVRALPIIEKRRAAIERERDELLQLVDEIDSAEVLDDVQSLVEDVSRLCRKRTSRQKKPTSLQGGMGPRRFVSVDGLEILVGRSARANDQLTFRLARGNDIFFHVSGRPGTHTIVRAEKGKQVPPETILDAATLTLYYSLPGQARQRAAEGAAAEVDYTPVKYVRKPRGAAPGLVLLARHKTLRVRLEKTRLARLRGDGGE